ncbi:MAG: hypothetical protein GW911_01515, partial [Armatimonadetes bacterium]|nr:hypothetical protein [Armatimonadota bacterium]
HPCIIAIGAHAADMEFTAGATLLKHARHGWAAHLVHLTLGEKGHARLSPSEYGAQKRQEAEDAARLLQATPHFLPWCDGELRVDDSTAAELARLFRQLRPTCLVTHWRDSIHGDHTAAHHLTHRALFMAANRHFELGGLPLVWAPIYYAENWEDSDNFRPFVYVDVSEELPDWRKAFECFGIGRGEGDFPYWDWYDARTRLNGIRIRVAHAQAFAVDEDRMIQRRELLSGRIEQRQANRRRPDGERHSARVSRRRRRSTPRGLEPRVAPRPRGPSDLSPQGASRPQLRPRLAAGRRRGWRCRRVLPLPDPAGASGARRPRAGPGVDCRAGCGSGLAQPRNRSASA